VWGDTKFFLSIRGEYSVGDTIFPLNYRENSVNLYIAITKPLPQALQMKNLVKQGYTFIYYSCYYQQEVMLRNECLEVQVGK